jgi:hypothetical protein
MTTRENTAEEINFEKDFQNHMMEMAKEIAGLHDDLLFFPDDYRVLESLLLGVEDSER